MQYAHKYVVGLTLFVAVLSFATPHASAAGAEWITPPANTILQRNGDGVADLRFALAPGGPKTEVTLSRPGQEPPLSRLTLGKGKTTGTFPKVSGGLYDLCARPLDKANAAKDCRRVGVGEVFLVAGQSNAVSTDLSHKRHASQTGMVAVNDYHGDLDKVKPEEGKPVVDRLVFTGPEAAITANVCWMRLGDMLAATCQVPVAFVNVARDATNSECWNPASGECWPLFARTLAQGKYRAVLWHQGESDAMLNFSQEKSFENIKSLITASRKIAPGIPWFVAHNSLKNETPYAQQPVRQAQAALVDQGLACAGPDTDVIRDNPDWVGVADFGAEGLTRHGELWFPAVEAFLREGTCRRAFGE